MEFREMYKPRGRVTVSCEGGGAKQSFKEECDINVIMRRYVSSGQLPPGVGVGSYGDFSGPSDLLEARVLLQRAEAQFASLPARVRERFKNDPGAFLAFVQDKANEEEARELGLLADESEEKRELKRLQKVAADAAAAVLAAAKPPADAAVK